MFSKTDKAYASAKHSVIRDMCVDPDELVFTLAQSLFLFLKKDFLDSPIKIFFKMAAKLSKTTAIRREKTPNPELRPLFRGNDWTRCIVTGEKNANHVLPWPGFNRGPPACTLPHRYKSRLVPQGSTRTLLQYNKRN